MKCIFRKVTHHVYCKDDIIGSIHRNIQSINEDWADCIGDNCLAHADGKCLRLEFAFRLEGNSIKEFVLQGVLTEKEYMKGVNATR